MWPLWGGLFYDVFPKKFQLNLIRRGAASNSGANRERWDLVPLNYSDEEETDGEDSDQSEGEDDSEQD